MSDSSNSFILLTPGEAVARAVHVEPWMWLKAPAALYLIWSFFAPQIWKTFVLLIANVVCVFVEPCPAGPGLSGSSLWIMALSQIFIIIGMFWYGVYLGAYLLSPGWRSKAVFVTLLLLFLPLMIITAIASGVIVSWLGVPLDAIWDLQDRWAPFESWRIKQ